MTFFAEALQSDVCDIQHGTTAEGVHLGAMAGTVDLVIAFRPVSRRRGMFYGSIRSCRRKRSPLTCASAIEGIRSTCISRATPSRSVEKISMWRRLRYLWQVRPMSS